MGLTLEAFDAILSDIYESLPDRPEDGQPLVLSIPEAEVFKKTGMVFKQWRDGQTTLILSPEKKEWFERILSR